MAEPIGWRDRPPTDDELVAHHRSHAGGPSFARVSHWLVTWGPYGSLALAAVTMLSESPFRDNTRGEWDHPGARWRPVTADGFPTFWPPKGGAS